MSAKPKVKQLKIVLYIFSEILKAGKVCNDIFLITKANKYSPRSLPPTKLFYIKTHDVRRTSQEIYRQKYLRQLRHHGKGYLKNIKNRKGIKSQC